jgi:DNA polymerase III epsilon subunit-like protein
VNYGLTGRSPVFLAVVTSGPDEDVHEILDVAVVAEDGSTILNTALLPSNIVRADPDFLARAGYNDGEWAPSPAPSNVGHALFRALEGGLVVGHDAQRAMRFVLPVVSEALWSQSFPATVVAEKLRSLDSPWIDTTTLAWEQLGDLGLQSLSLEAVADFVGVAPPQMGSALSEARTVREVYVKLLRAGWFQRLWWRLANRR